MATAVRPVVDTVVPPPASEQSPAAVITPPRKLNLFRRLRGKKTTKKQQEPAEEDVTTAQEESSNEASPKEAAKTLTTEQPPPARQAAYGGPPRYDWIDIETAAAVKVQSIARRNYTMAQLADQGVSTAAMRNRDRRRRAQRSGTAAAAGSADVPNLFACCGIGLAFGDATEEEYETTRAHQREEYYQRKQEKEQREAELRETFNKTAAQKKAARTSDVQEAYEIVE